MNQTNLMELLVNASKCTSWSQAETIQDKLVDATHGGESYPHCDSLDVGIRATCRILFRALWEDNRHLLPTCFPAFAIMCGNDPAILTDWDFYFAEIDWTVYGHTHKTAPAIHTFECSTWGWVKLSELAEIVGMKPSEVLHQYGELTTIYPYIAVCDRNDVSNTSIVSLIESVKIYEVVPFAKLDATFVPAGWSKAVLAAHRAK
ncbi:hypothetical protein KBA63_03175 [Candidatus Woesebacteria bacterium]|nr:hypothetical protein [Candidatus Woesebacteria bacterium]MBP9687348.1 hypothetical protein [Candidatus Woesebacteria bacterium]